MIFNLCWKSSWWTHHPYTHQLSSKWEDPEHISIKKWLLRQRGTFSRRTKASIEIHLLHTHWFPLRSVVSFSRHFNHLDNTITKFPIPPFVASSLTHHHLLKMPLFLWTFFLNLPSWKRIIKYLLFYSFLSPYTGSSTQQLIACWISSACSHFHEV